MNSQQIYTTLKQLLFKIGKEKILWYLEGSVNLFVQSVPIEPKDIDITTNPEDLAVFRKILKKEIIKDFYISEKKAHVLKCLLNKREVEIAVYEDKDKSSFNTIKNIIWKDLKLPAQPLLQALKFYKRIKRQDKVQLLEQFLAKN
ncbi:MAG: hypothetical protein AABY00_02275 [Nanoarchaeota archaeon]